MRLKRWTTALAVWTAVLMVMWPIIVGVPPIDATRRVKARYALRAQVYVPVLLLSLLGTAICSIYVARAARERYLAESAENLRQLIEGTLQDHRKKSEPDEAS